MASLKLLTILDKVMQLNIEGVKTKQKFPPSSVSTAQLPLMYVRDCSVSFDQRSLTFQNSLPTYTIELVILIEASRQNTQEELYEKTRKMIDGLVDALELNAAELRLDDYEVKEDFEAADTNSFFVVLANIRCS